MYPSDGLLSAEEVLEDDSRLSDQCEERFPLEDDPNSVMTSPTLSLHIEYTEKCFTLWM